MKDQWRIAQAFAETLWVTRRGRSRADFEQWQANRLKHWLKHDLRRVDYYSDVPRHLDTLDPLPIIDKTTVMADFAAFNRGRITTEQGWQAFAEGGQREDVAIGASTGTSGNRMLYAVTSAERFRWLGTMLAKTVPFFLMRPERVAVILPQSSSLYDSAKDANRLRLAFFDLKQGMESWLLQLEAFAPTTIVAPPRVLRHLAEHGARLSPRRLYAGAETLDPVDREVIEARFRLRLGQIYMATEGLFAVTCAQGRLHLAEDANVFEFEPVDGGLVSPLVTGFRRSFQVMARYRMNDLLRLSSRSCSCGSPLRVVEEVVGRMDDVFTFKRHNDVPVLVTPDVMRNAILDASRQIADFRIIREDQETIALILDPALDEGAASAALAGLQNLFRQRGLSPVVVLRHETMVFDSQRKLRRVENRWKDHGCA